MSRVGKQTIQIPTNVTVETNEGILAVKGPKGELTRKLPSFIHIKIEDGHANVTVDNPEEKKSREMWGTFASHLINMVEGVTNGFQKKLEINGVGYAVSIQGTNLKLEVGYSHSVFYPIPAMVTAKVEKNTITLASADKELLGKVAAEIRSIRKPEPYKGKGIKYSDETIRRKAGKAAKSA